MELHLLLQLFLKICFNAQSELYLSETICLVVLSALLNVFSKLIPFYTKTVWLCVSLKETFQGIWQFNFTAPESESYFNICTTRIYISQLNYYKPH